MVIEGSVAHVDLDAVRHNLRVVRERVAPGCAVLGVVKANAYGHGAVEVARVLVAEGVTMLGVGRVAEGLELRRGGIGVPILVMGGVAPEMAESIVGHDLRAVVSCLASAQALSRAAASRQGISRLHVKVDTGMARLGFPAGDALEAIRAIHSYPAIRVEGVMTHLADAEGDPEYTTAQLRQFTTLLEAINGAGLSVPVAHAANSAGILSRTPSHFDMVRPGIMLYGYAPSGQPPDRFGLRPALSWQTVIIEVRSLSPGATVGYGRAFAIKRQSRIAVLPVGYADGMSRSLSNTGSVLIGGRRAPIVGRICMDLLMVDITDHPGACVGDEVVLIGRQGAEAILATELADLTGTIPYEILCRIGNRVPRVAHDSRQT